MKRYGLLTLFFAVMMSWPLAGQCPWKIGEEMEFDIRALNINAARQVVKVLGMTNINGRDAYVIWTEVKSTPFADAFYKLRDTMITYLDASNFNTLKYLSQKYEGGWTDETVITNCVASNAIWYYDRNGLVDVFKTSPPVVDLVGMIYYGRTIPLGNALIYKFNLIDFRKIRTVEARVSSREYRRIKFLDRKNDVRLVKMKETKDNDMAIWLTDDERRLPVHIITMKIKLGSLCLGNLESILTKYKEK